jgi:hypothetical protein
MKKFDFIWIPRGLAFLIALASLSIVILYFFHEPVFLLLIIPIIHFGGFFVSLYAPKWLGKGFLYLLFCLCIILSVQFFVLISSNGCSEATDGLMGPFYYLEIPIIVTSILFFVFLRKNKI